MRLSSGFVSLLLALGLIGLFAWWGVFPFGGHSASEIDVDPPKPVPASSSPGAGTQSLPSQAPPAPTVVPPAPNDPQKPPLLANEKAEVERFAALREKAEEAPAKSKPVPKLLYRVEVRDAGTLVAGGMVITLAGISARTAEAQCADKNGKSWPCGAAARTALARLIQTRAVSCLQPPGDKKEFAARCSVGGTDLSSWLVEQGWAEPRHEAEASLLKAAEAARQNHLGLWRAAE
jgi:endonuclease YncB( thermonuclease family)